MIDSASFQRFGEKYLSKPGRQAGIEKRTFAEVKKEDIEQRKDEVNFVFWTYTSNNFDIWL